MGLTGAYQTKNRTKYALMVEQADASDLKSAGSNTVPVRIWVGAPNIVVIMGVQPLYLANEITNQAAALFKLNAHNIGIENRLFTVRNVTGDKAADAGLGGNDALSVKNQNASAANTFQLMQELCHIITLFL